MALIDLPLAKIHLKVDETTHEDDLIQVYIGAAESIAMEFLNRKVFETTEEMAAAVLDGSAGDSPILINDSIKAAMLLILTDLHSNRSNVVIGASVAELPRGSVSMLWPFRIGLGV